MPTPTPVFLRAGSSLFWEKIAQWYQNSTIGELITYLHQTYFSMQFGAYNNFAISERAAHIINQIIPALIWGIIIAAVVTVYSRRSIGTFVKTLLKKEALSPNSAITLFDSGSFRSTIVRRQLCRNAFLKKVVFCREEQEFLEEQKKSKEQNQTEEQVATDAQAENTPPKKRKDQWIDATYQIDFTKDHFYIPEDLKYRAEFRFSTKGFGWMAVVMTVILIPIIVGVLCRFMPNLLQFADAIITFFAP
jgi:hypothetical protein